MIFRAVVLLLVLGLSTGNVLPKAASSSVRPSTAPASFNTSELQCFAQEKVLHPDGNCYKLRAQGPCERDQWLVLDKDEVFVPDGRNRRRLVCRPKPCSNNRVYWPEDGQCHKRTEKTRLCGFPGNVLRSDSFGEGECACESAYIRYKPDVMKGGQIVWNGACYPLYQRGPCPVRKILEADNLDGFGPVGVCSDDACHRENSLAPGTWYARASDGRCYKLGERGPCAAQHTFQVDPATNRAECVGSSVVVNGLFNSTERCDGNLNMLTNTCRETFELRAPKFGENIGINRPRPRPRRGQTPAAR